MDRKVALKAHLDRLNRGEARKVEAAKKAGKTYVAKKFKITDKSTEKPEHVVLRLGARTKTGYKTELGQGAKMLGNKHIAPRIATAKETAEGRKSAAKLKKNLIRVPREYLGSKPYSKVKAEVRRHLSTSMRAAKSRGNTALAKAVSASVAQKRGARKNVRLKKAAQSAFRNILKRPKVADWKGRLDKRIDIGRAKDAKAQKNQDSPASKRKSKAFWGDIDPNAVL